MSSSCTSSMGLNTICVFGGSLLLATGPAAATVLVDIAGGVGPASGLSSWKSGVSTNFNPSANVLGLLVRLLSLRLLQVLAMDEEERLLGGFEFICAAFSEVRVLSVPLLLESSVLSDGKENLD